MLIGIQFYLIHPKPVHSLPNGLTVHKTNLLGHDTALRGHIVQQIGRFKAGHYSTKPVHSTPKTLEEIKFARVINCHDGEPELKGLLKLEEKEEELQDQYVKVLALEEVNTDMNTEAQQMKEQCYLHWSANHVALQLPL